MLNIKSVRTKKLVRNVLGSSFYKGINIVFSFLLVRYSIEFIGEEKYGVWLAFLSFFTWFSVFEVGITNSLRNQLTKYFADHQYKKSKQLILKGYKALIIVYFPLIGLLTLLFYFTPVEAFFLEKENYGLGFNFAFRVSLVFYLLHYIFFFLNSILLAIHYTKSIYHTMRNQRDLAPNRYKTAKTSGSNKFVTLLNV